MMDKPATQAVESFTHAGYDLDAKAILLCESDGTPEEVAEEIVRMTAVLREHGATRIQVSRNERAAALLVGPQNAFPAAGRISPDYYCMDGTVPRRAIGRCSRASSSSKRATGCAASTCSMRATATCIR